jgi:hypothetical protein
VAGSAAAAATQGAIRSIPKLNSKYYSGCAQGGEGNEKAFAKIFSGVICLAFRAPGKPEKGD